MLQRGEGKTAVAGVNQLARCVSPSVMKGYMRSHVITRHRVRLAALQSHVLLSRLFSRTPDRRGYRRKTRSEKSLHFF